MSRRKGEEEEELTALDKFLRGDKNVRINFAPPDPDREKKIQKYREGIERLKEILRKHKMFSEEEINELMKGGPLVWSALTRLVRGVEALKAAQVNDTP
jgi:hypothetical protein